MPVTNLTILSEGQAVPATFQFLSVDIHRELNRIPSAHLELIDGDPALQTFDASDSQYFEPGRLIEIKLGYDDKVERVFKGKVVRHGLGAGPRGSTLSVGLKDEAVKLTGARSSSVFRKMKDSEVFSKILREAGLKAGKIDASSAQPPEIVQYNCTDWDFLLARAEALGYVIAVEDGTVSIRKLESPSSADIEVEFGRSEVYEFEIRADAGTQINTFQTSSWQAKNQASKVAKAAAFRLKQGNLDGKKLATALGFGPDSEQHQVPMLDQETQDWASARMARSRMSLYRGRVSIAGMSGVKLLQGLSLTGFGARFNGKALITGVRHRVGEGNWLTDVQFGLSDEPFARTPDLAPMPAGGVIPKAGGIQVGIVTSMGDDPEKLSRIKIKVPALSDQEELWARLGSPYAGNKRGYFFRPEVGDEVIVAFFNEDPRFPVILGSLYSSKNPPPAKAQPDDKDNNGKAIVTRAGVVIGFLDKSKASVFIETPSGRKILFDDDGEKIELTDPNNNTITMDKNGIVIKSGKDFKIDASGNVEIKGQKVDVK